MKNYWHEEDSRTPKKWYTTLEESEKLYAALGLDLTRKTADMRYIIKRDELKNDWHLYATRDPENVKIRMVPFEADFTLNDYLLPAWSFGALVDLMPKSIMVDGHEAFRDIFWTGISYHYTIPPKNGTFIESMYNNVFGDEDIMKNAVNCVLWLHEQNYI